MQYEVINLGTKVESKNVNLGTQCSPFEKTTFIKLFQEFKYVLAWLYNDLKIWHTHNTTCDTLETACETFSTKDSENASESWTISEIGTQQVASSRHHIPSKTLQMGG